MPILFSTLPLLFTQLTRAASLQTPLTQIPMLASLEQPAPSRDSSRFTANHWEAIVFAASLIAAGLGASAYFWRRKRSSPPSDGVQRTEAQAKTLATVLKLEQDLRAVDRNVRFKAIFELLGLLRPLVPTDRPERLRRIAAQLCMDWPSLHKDRKLGDEIKNRIPRLPRPLLAELTAEITKKADPHGADTIRANADAILKWINGK
jgi:hypothetical protein